MEYRLATISDIDAIFGLQKKYHIDTIAESDKKNGFVTTLFTKEQLKDLIILENGIAVAVNDNIILGYAMAASWSFWSSWPLFAHMIGDLENTIFDSHIMSTENSYQYGPICLAKEVRSSKVMENLFNFSLKKMADKYQYMITFVNINNQRSYVAHTKKVGMSVIKTFKFNGNCYYELAIKTK